MSLFTDGVILYVAYPKESRYTHIPGTNKFSKVLGHKINKRNLLYLHILMTNSLKKKLKQLHNSIKTNKILRNDQN